MEVELQGARFTSEVTPEGYRWVIPARGNWLVLLLLCAWLVGWTIGELTVSGQLARGAGKTPDAFLAVWLLGWTCAGLFVAVSILWQLAGREIISVGPTTLCYRAEALALGRTRSFRAAEVKDLRATPAPSAFGYRRSWWPPIVGSGYGVVAFDYGARTFRIAPSLDEAEAKLLVKELSARLPSGSVEAAAR
jgi:hypothetical protein